MGWYQQQLALDTHRSYNAKDVNARVSGKHHLLLWHIKVTNNTRMGDDAIMGANIWSHEQ